MDTAPIPLQSSIEHSTILTFSAAIGAEYCALTLIARDGDQRQCAISRRVGFREPSFIDAMNYAKTNLYPNRKADSVSWIDHEFELLANSEILHRFVSVRATSTGEITREGVDLTMHQAWTERVQPAVRLLLQIGA